MLSIPHLVIIFLVALIVLGPEKLPQVARTLGKAMADFRRITTDFRVQVEDEMREMERQTRLQQMTAASVAHPPGTEPSHAELLGATPAEIPAETPVPAPAEQAPAPASETPADGKSQPA